jgi:metal-responsive CopG/Arc/MetJ family transcriptional regulator
MVISRTLLLRLSNGGKMNTRIGIRVSKELRAELDQAVKSGQFKSISGLIRRLVEDYLKKARKTKQQKSGVAR